MNINIVILQSIFKKQKWILQNCSTWEEFIEEPIIEGALEEWMLSFIKRGCLRSPLEPIISDHYINEPPSSDDIAIFISDLYEIQKGNKI